MIGWQRIWNTGMPQVMIGAAVTLTAQEVIRAALSGVF